VADIIQIVVFCTSKRDNKTAEQDILPHGVKPKIPSMKHKLLRWFLSIIVGI